ncbi:MAG: hypothetical protein AB8H47_22955 [Bacteroidia bacterium]
MKNRWILTLLLSAGVLPAFAGLSYNKALISPNSVSATLGQNELQGDDHWDDGYWDEDYDEFRYSRRLRRFHSVSSVDVSWSYYDPYYTTDVYYVIGTSYWDDWNYAYNPWSNQSRRYGSRYGNNRSWFGGGFSTTVVYTSGWNPWGYSPYYYYGGYNNCGFYNYGNAGYGWSSRWNNNRGWNRGYNQGFNQGYNNGYRNGYYDGYYSGYNNGSYQTAGRNNDYWYERSTRSSNNTGRYARTAGSNSYNRSANSQPRRTSTTDRVSNGRTASTRPAGTRTAQSSGRTSDRTSTQRSANSSQRSTPQRSSTSRRSYDRPSQQRSTSPQRSPKSGE